MKRIAVAALSLLMTCSAVYAEVPELKFRKDKTFKIVQFTDTHIRTFNKPETEEVYNGMDYVIKTEKPDLVVLTGDLVTVTPAAPEWQRLAGFLDGHKVPWIVVYGNHDAEQDLSRPDMSAIIAGGQYSLNTLNGKGELADVELKVSSRSSDDGKFYVFCMDSHDYNHSLGERCYDWFHEDQIQWLRDCCAARTAKDGTVAPSFAFFHIPLNEYIDAWALRDTGFREHAKSSQSDGIRGEGICCPGLNSGMFAAMKESGSVMGVSVGHDHDNDFLAVYHGIVLGYGRFSGSNTVYNGLPHGSKVFLLREGEKGFETWIREYSGRIVLHSLFDGEILIPSKRKDRALPYGGWDEIER